ncbi:MAG: SAM hydrolase/SAM-dependent halogenase family protein [Halothece sp.]
MMLTLTTDFGLQDAYVGVMKGIIANINPEVKIIDLTHQIPPQNILAGRFSLLNSIPYFPIGTVHVAVIDPGVGSDRAGCAIQFSQGFLVGPNNGIFSGILNQFPAQKVVNLTNSEYWRSENISSTFHGRDIFAPVAAHLAKGVPLTNFGNEMSQDELINVSFPSPEIRNDSITGYIQYIDYFGNLISNILGSEIKGKSWYIRVKDTIINSGNTYSDAPPQELIAIIGSHGWLEIAMNQGNASSVLSLNYGEAIEVYLGWERWCP